jgi:hypothetical protein
MTIMVVFCLIGIVGGRVQLGPLGTAATNRPIVPAPDDYDDREFGGMIGTGWNFPSISYMLPLISFWDPM